MSYIKYGVNLLSNYLYIYTFLIKCYILLQPEDQYCNSLQNTSLYTVIDRSNKMYQHD